MLSTPEIWLAPAKINLFLHINSKRGDGYHNLQTIFQLVDFYDELKFSVREDGDIKRFNGNEDINTEKDLIVRAAKLLQQKSNTSLGVDISINKNIPMGGGLGGGSSDAATTLVALNHLWKLGLSQKQLIEIGIKLGADIPIFIYGRSAWADGIGEILSPVNPPENNILIIHINKHTSTKEIFSHKALTMSPMIGKISDFSEVENTHNDTQAAAIENIGEIGDALNYLDSCNNLISKAKMSGTGSCVFAQFKSEKDALAAYKKMPDMWLGIATKTINTSPILNWAVAKR